MNTEKRPHLEVVSEQYTALTRSLRRHEAFRGLDSHYVDGMSNREMLAYIETWKRHTPRGRAWVAEQDRKMRALLRGEQP